MYCFPWFLITPVLDVLGRCDESISILARFYDNIIIDYLILESPRAVYCSQGKIIIKIYEQDRT